MSIQIPTTPTAIAVGNQVPVNASGISVAPNTGPSVASFQGSTCLFFTGSGNNGVWFTTSQPDGGWSGVQQIIPPNQTFLGLAPGTSPAVVVNPLGAPRLFVFYTGSGANGVFFTSAPDLVHWAATAAVPGSSVEITTSPTAVWFSNQLFVFYNSSVPNSGVYCMASGTQTTWPGLPFPVATQTQEGGGLQMLNIDPNTSPSAAVFGGSIYLVFSANGSVWLTTSSDGEKWSQLQALTNLTGSTVSINPGGSPTVAVQNAALYVFWPSGSGLQGTITLDGTTWEEAIAISSVQNISAEAGVSLPPEPGESTLFWTSAANANVASIFSAEVAPVYSLEAQSSPANLVALASSPQSFILVIDDADTLQLVDALFPQSATLQSVMPQLRNGGVTFSSTAAQSGGGAVTPSQASFLSIVFAAFAAKFANVLVGEIPAGQGTTILWLLASN